MKRKTKTVDEVAGLLHKSGRKAKATAYGEKVAGLLLDLPSDMSKPATSQPLKISAAMSRRLEKLAKEANTTPQRMLGFVLRDGLEYNNYAVKAINEGLADIEAGRMISHEDMMKQSAEHLDSLAEENGTHKRQNMSEREPTAQWEVCKSWKEIAPGVDIDDDWPGFELVYVRIEGAQPRVCVWDGPDGTQSEIIIALPRKVAECFLPLEPVPDDPFAGLKKLDELFKKQKKTPPPRGKRKPSNDAG